MELSDRAAALLGGGDVIQDREKLFVCIVGKILARLELPLSSLELFCYFLINNFFFLQVNVNYETLL